VPVIRVETEIAASPEECFDSHRDLGLHVLSAKGSGERIVGERQEGLLELGDEVTFEARHFGFKFRMTSKIVEFDRPRQFVDEMTKGPFKRLRHIHRFEPTEGGTNAIDEMEFASPFGLMGLLVDRLFVSRHLREFLMARNVALKRILEGDESPMGH